MSGIIQQFSPLSFDIPKTQTALTLSKERENFVIKRIKYLLKKRNAVIVAHYYTQAEIQKLADETAGFVGDSLKMAEFGRQHSATTLLIVGVRFMAETAKILNPEKQVLMPDLSATCSLDLGCPVDLFTQFCQQNPNRTIVVYSNTSAAVKAQADWVVTSSIALPIVQHLVNQNKKLLWAPDKYLGHYIQSQTQADMLIWPGSCVVHEEFKAQGIAQLQRLYPDAAVLVHPESPPAVIKLADVVGSTSRLIQAVQHSEHQAFIVATDRGIFYKMQQVAPNKTLHIAPTGGQGATCRSCAHCPWMAMNHLENVLSSLELENESNTIQLDPVIIEKARQPIQKMMNFAQKL